ncbi:MAG: DUF1588 domain-containing protein [Planctomycetales bacterium]
MLATKYLRGMCLPLSFLVLAANGRAADDFEGFLKPLLAKNCAKCHGGKKPKGEIDLRGIATAKQLLGNPKLIKEVIEAVAANDMPPEDEPQLDEKTRVKLIASLKSMLRESTSGNEIQRIPIRRLNRFQYNNSVKDLFGLKIDVFNLTEKLMTRHGNYLDSGADKMPDRVQASCRSLIAEGGMQDVNAYPKDLRAAHGFDNQANQLTLSPLLLDAFLKLSVSILDSPDFKPENVGAWNDFFKEPAAGSDLDAEVRNRLAPFLRKAFRRSVDNETLDRYAVYAVSKIKAGSPFTDGMKQVASAALSSPMFLYRYGSEDGKEKQFELASDLSFFLWGSSPDLELLRLAESGELSKPENLTKTLDRMFADPKIERFLDAFPAQWMQLENVLGATPDPRKHKFFSLDKNNPASLQMVLEPLLLFDAVFMEDRPVIELIAPEFSYQSDFLKTWYNSDLTPPKVDSRQVVEENRVRDEKRKSLGEVIKSTQQELDALILPVRSKLLAARKQGGSKEPVDLKPHAAWEFNGDLKSSANALELKAHGKIKYENGMVVLNNAYLQSKILPIELKAKTLEAWCKLGDVNQRGGGVMTVQGPGDFFDSIVLGERKPRHWISGSNGFSRTEDFPGSTDETATNEMLHLAMVYQADGTTALYRNGKPYGKSYRKAAAAFPKNQTTILFGLRHLPAGGGKHLNVKLDKARLYDRALSAEEVAASHSGDNLHLSDADVLAAMSPEQQAKRTALTKTLKQSEIDLKRVPKNQDPRRLQQDSQKRFENEMRNKMRSRNFQRTAASDPRYGGVITNAAMMSMTSGPKRTHPIARGAWIIEVIFNDPPPPPPNDVPPLNEDAGAANLTIREKFAQHRENPVCAGCHARLDPLGFALENFDITGRWRDKYENGRDVDSSGTLMKKYQFDGVVRFKESLVKEDRRFAKAFTGHLLRFALSRELAPVDSLTIDAIVDKTESEKFKLKSLIREVVLSESFLPTRN